MATYYIKNAGDDTKDGLSDGNAWQTVAKVNTEFTAGSFSAGDTISFNRGDTFNDAQLIIKQGGSVGSILTIGAYGTGAKPIFTWTVGAINCATANLDYITIQDLKLLNVSGGQGIRFNANDLTNITISRVDIDTVTGYTGITLVQVDTYIIEDCNISGCGNGGIAIMGSPSYACTNGIIRNNTIYALDAASGNDCITLHRDGSSNDVGAYHYIYNNTLHTAEEQGLDLNSGSYIVVRDNETYGNPIGGAVIGYATQVWIEGHYFHNNTGFGVTVSQNAQDIVLAKSVAYNDTQDLLWNAGTNAYYANNTFVAGSATGRMNMVANTADTITMRNNIFTSTQTGAPTTYWHHQSPATPTSSSTDADYNIWWNPDGDDTDLWYDATNSNYDFSGATSWQTTYSQDANGSFADPGLIDPANENFNLQTGSNSIDAGTWLTTITSVTGSGTAFVVADPKWFHDGVGLTTGSVIQLEGDSSSVTVTDVNYGTSTITVGSSVSWTQGDGVAFAFSGSAPDVGANEFVSGVAQHYMTVESGNVLTLESGMVVTLD